MLRQLTFIATVAASLTALGTATGQAQQAAVEDIFAPVVGQQQPVPDTVQKPLKAASQRKTTVAVQKVAKTIDPAALAGGNESDQRIGQLEAQIADMQVVVGTMESMTRGRGAAAPSANLGAAAGAGGDLDIRVGRLENQMQSLGGQLTDLSNQIRLMNAKLGGGAAILRAPTAPAANGQQGALTPQVPAKQTALTAALSEQPANADTGFGQTTVIPDGQDQSLGQDGAPAIQAATPDAQQPDTQVAGLGEQPVAPPAGPQDAYDLAYGRVLQQDYAGA